MQSLFYVVVFAMGSPAGAPEHGGVPAGGVRGGALYGHPHVHVRGHRLLQRRRARPAHPGPHPGTPARSPEEVTGLDMHHVIKPCLPDLKNGERMQDDF